MKQKLHKLFAFLAILLLPFALSAQEYGFVLTESFEEGLPSTWQQEKVSGDFSWVVENGGTNPTGAFDGEKRMSFCNTSGVTTKSKTRLITPIFDISRVYQPILIFAHAQDKWTGDFDTLRVLYRTSADADWTELKVYDTAIPRWQVDTLRLIAANKTYQLAFEASDNLGRGVVIDDIEVRSTPNCLDPYDLMVSNVTNNSATLGWLGAFDAVSFALKVSTVSLTLEQLNDATFTADVLDTLISDAWSCDLTNLEQGLKYYFYLKSNCDVESSSWAGATFSTSNLLSVPYYQDFNLEYTPGFVARVPGWTCEATTNKPYVNTGSSGLGQYMSKDGSFVLLFNGQNDNFGTSKIPAGEFAYAALPQVDLPSVSDLQVSFWTVRSWPGNSQRFSIIVGVMTDPTVKGSFVPVDTVNITSAYEYEECIVPLSSYTGTGKYIALMSDFAESNIFLIDDLKVDYIPEIEKATFNVGIPTATSFKLDFDQSYSKYEVVVASKEKEVADLEVATDVIRAEIADNGVIEGVSPRSEFFVYARAIKGTKKGEWSNAKRVRTPGKVAAVPYTTDFEINKEDSSTFYNPRIGWSVATSSYMTPDVISHTNTDTKTTCVNTYWGKTSGVVALTPYELYLTINGSSEKYMMAVLPEMLDPKDTRITFAATAHLADYGSTFFIGTMSDANDPSTFDPIDTIKLGLGYEYFAYELDQYDTEGRFIAFKVDRTVQTDFSYTRVYIDDVKYEKIPECRYSTNMDAIYYLNEPSKVTLSWDANGVTKWNVRVAEEKYVVDSFYVDSLDFDFVYEGTVTTNSLELKNLKFPGNKYYYWIQSVCDGVLGMWTRVSEFETQCYDAEPIPYFEDFNSSAYSTSTKDPVFAVPCMYSQKVKYSTSYYPNLSTSKKVGASGNSLELKKNKNWKPAGVNTYVALPKMSVPLNELELTLKLYVENTTHTLTVGVLEDPMDTANIDVISVIRPKLLKEFVEYNISFEDYTGKGEYIVLTTNNTVIAPVLYIDDIMVDYLPPCPRPEDLVLSALADTTVTFSWKKTKATQWRIMLANERLTEKELASDSLPTDKIVSIDTVTTNPAVINGLTENTSYYAYIQTICGNGLAGIWSNPLPFKTTCEIRTAGELGVENFDTYGTGSGKYPSCYIVGNVAEEATSTYIPYCYTTYKHSGKASMRLYSTTTYNGAYVITSPIGVDDISKLRVSFWGSIGSTTYDTDAYARAIMVGVLTDPADLATFVPIDTVSLAYEGRPYEVDLSSYICDYNGDKGKYVMFYSYFDKDNYAFIDDLSFDTIPACTTRFEAENITHNSFDVRFISESAPYQLKYATEMCDTSVLNNDSILPPITVTGDRVSLTDLQPNVSYYLYARSTCGEGYTDWSNVEVVRTACLEMRSLPFYDGFEDQIASAGQPNCWNSYYSASSEYPKLSSSYCNTGKRTVYVYASATAASYLVTPELDVQNISKTLVSFYMRPSATNADKAVIVGVVSNLNDIPGSFVAIDTIIVNQGTATHELQVVSLESYTGTGKYVAFTTDYQLNAKKASGVYIDDITIEALPPCIELTNLEFRGATDTSLTVGFIHAEEALKYELKYSTDLSFDPDSAGTSVFITETEGTITDLAPETTYSVYARAHCNETDISMWSHVGERTTIGEPWRSTFPYSFNFEDEVEAAKWNFKQDGQKNQWFIGADTLHMVTDMVDNGGKALFISNDNGLSANYSVASTSYSWAYRTIELEAGTYTASYDWTCYGQATNDYIRVGLVPASSVFNKGSSKVTAIDGSNVSMTYTVATQPKGWIELSEEVYYSATTNYYKNNLVDTTQTLANQWEFVDKVFTVSPEQAGLYNLVFYWKNDASKGEYADTRSAVVDNIVINRETCSNPIDLTVVDYGAFDVNLSWKSGSGTPMGYEVMFTTEELENPERVTDDQVVARQFMDTTAGWFNGFAETTTYYFYVRSICSTNANDTSMWSGPGTFTTVCAPAAVDSVFNFDSEDGYYLNKYSSGTTANTTYKVPNCFVSTHDTLKFTSTYAKYYPYLIKNGTTIYSRSGDYALYFTRSNNTTYDGGTIALPLIEGDREELQLTFWMRCVTHNASTKKLATTAVGSTYNRKIIVGTMNDPYDPKSFEELAIVEYPYTSNDLTSSLTISDDPSESAYWVEMSVPLENAKGKYIAFKNYGGNYSDATTNNTVYIDDIKVTSLTCLTPTYLDFDSITSTSAILASAVVSESEKYVVQIAESADFENVESDTVTSLPVTFSGLKPSTTYYVRLQSICNSKDVSKWSVPYDFTTLTPICYDRDFSNLSYCPEDWSRATAPTLEEYFDGKTVFSYSSFGTSSGWISKPALWETGLFSTRHIKAQVYTTYKYWLFTPSLELPKADAQLVFDLALTAYDDVAPVTEMDKKLVDDRFVVLISDDAGETWTEENMVVWGHENTDFKFFDIPNTGRTYKLDLSKFAGKGVKIAFYVESTMKDDGGRFDIHLDNVHINTYENEVINVALCQTEDFDQDPFYISSENLNIGVNSFTYLDLSKEKTDKNYKVDILVTPMAETTVEATICEGDVYSGNNFSGLTKPGVYKQKLVSSNGCDSVVVLDLSVTPAARTMILDTICYGNSVIWNGVEYDRTGVYFDTLVSKVTGCDSILTFVLNVQEAIRTDKYVNICFGDTYQFGSQTISATGEYSEQFVTAEGCDSIVTLHATVLPDFRQTIHATIREGETYNDNGFVGLKEPGEYTLPLKSVEGCDSTVTLVLAFGDPVAVENANLMDLVLVPNPVKVDNTLYVNAEFSAEEAKDLVVEVFNALGQRVYVEKPTTYPIAIVGLTQRGVYLVRITAGNGETYQGKVVVE